MNIHIPEKSYTKLTEEDKKRLVDFIMMLHEIDREKKVKECLKNIEQNKHEEHCL